MRAGRVIAIVVAGTFAFPGSAPARCVKTKTFQAMMHNGFREGRLDPGTLTSSSPITTYDTRSQKRLAFLRTLLNARESRGKQIALQTFGAYPNTYEPRSVKAFLGTIGTPTIRDSTAPSGSGTGDLEFDSNFNEAFAKAGTIRRFSSVGARLLFTAKAHQPDSQDPTYLGGHRGGPRTHVIAWGPVLQEPQAMAQLRAIAADTGGEFYTASGTSKFPAIAKRLAKCLNGRRT